MAIAAHGGRVTGRDTENVRPVQAPVRADGRRRSAPGKCQQINVQRQQKEIFDAPVDKQNRQRNPQPHRREAEGFPANRRNQRVDGKAHADVDAGEHRVQHDGMIEKRQDGMPRQKQIYCPGARRSRGSIFLSPPGTDRGSRRWRGVERYFLKNRI